MAIGKRRHLLPQWHRTPYRHALKRLTVLRWTRSIGDERYRYLRQGVRASRRDLTSLEFYVLAVEAVPSRAERIVARQCAKHNHHSVDLHQFSQVPDRTGLWAPVESRAIIKFIGIVQLLAAVTAAICILGLSYTGVRLPHGAFWVDAGCLLLALLVSGIGIYASILGTRGTDSQGKAVVNGALEVLREPQNPDQPT